MAHSKSAVLGKKFSCSICGNLYENENRTIGLFSVPKTKLHIWQSAIPELKQTSRLCDSHFDEKDIVKGYFISQTFIPNDRWRLHPSALPKHFLGMYLFLYSE
jgi:hypothetical protein